MVTDPADVARRLIESLRDGGDTGLPTYDEMSRADQARWDNAVREARAGGPFLIRAPTRMDLTESSFDWARETLDGVPPSQCTIIHGPASAGAARRVADRVGCYVIEVPPSLMKYRFGWAVVCATGCVWSEGLD